MVQGFHQTLLTAVIMELPLPFHNVLILSNNNILKETHVHVHTEVNFNEGLGFSHITKPSVSRYKRHTRPNNSMR